MYNEKYFSCILATLSHDCDINHTIILLVLLIGSFQDEIEKVNDLHSLVCDQKLMNKPIEIIFKNIYYVYEGLTAGLSYLHEKKLVHGDIKGAHINRAYIIRGKQYNFAHKAFMYHIIILLLYSMLLL